MQSDALLAILGMALVTYATRAGGFWLIGRVQLAPRLAAWLRQLPGAILVSLVAPIVLTGGPAELLGVLATVLAAARTGSVLLALAVGVATVWLVRMLV